MTIPKWLDKVLNDVNRIRLCLEMPEVAQLPLAVPGNPEECVLALALSNGWRSEVGDEIQLTWEGEGEQDFGAIVKALRIQNFEAEAYGIDQSIEIQLTAGFARLIDRFDSWLLTELVSDEVLKREYDVAVEELEMHKAEKHLDVRDVRRFNSIVKEYESRVKSA